MSIEKRTLSVPREVTIVRCDGPDCERTITHDPEGKSTYHRTEWEASTWWSCHQQNVEPPVVAHFCSVSCLALWAEQRAMPHAVDVQP